MTRSMSNGKPLPMDSREMRGVLAYFAWLAEGTEKNMAMEGSGLLKLDLPKRKASISNGKVIFEKHCVACHSANGAGMKKPDYEQTGLYLVPPLAGKDSFNDGAGMSRIITATRFIHANMPQGTDPDHPTLTVEEAFDVAGYVESLSRPSRPGRDNDFPNANFRPKDYPVPAYFGNDTAALDRAKYGPFD
jgi:cytochrome c